MVQNAGLAVPVGAEAVSPGQLGQNRELIQAVRRVNAAELFGQENELTFLLDCQTRQLVVRVVNRKTNEVVRQSPPEYILRLSEELREQDRP